MKYSIGKQQCTEDDVKRWILYEASRLPILPLPTLSGFQELWSFILANKDPLFFYRASLVWSIDSSKISTFVDFKELVSFLQKKSLKLSISSESQNPLLDFPNEFVDAAIAHGLEKESDVIDALNYSLGILCRTYMSIGYLLWVKHIDKSHNKKCFFEILVISLTIILPFVFLYTSDKSIINFVFFSAFVFFICLLFLVMIHSGTKKSYQNKYLCDGKNALLARVRRLILSAGLHC